MKRKSDAPEQVAARQYAAQFKKGRSYNSLVAYAYDDFLAGIKWAQENTIPRVGERKDYDPLLKQSEG